MPYSKMLQKIINSTNYNNAEIAEKCKKLGVDVDRSYINKLFNGKSKPPKEEISRAIAKVCNADERLLVLEGYIDKAPKEILTMLKHMQFLSYVAAIKLYSNVTELSQEFLTDCKIEIDKQPIADFVLDLLNKQDVDISFKKDALSFSKEDNNYSLNLFEPVALIVPDSAMYPLIPQNSKINLNIKSEYSNGEIIAFKIKGKEELYVRYIFYNDTDNKIMLTALNTEFKPIICRKEDIVILGKVSSVIHDIL